MWRQRPQRLRPAWGRRRLPLGRSPPPPRLASARLAMPGTPAGVQCQCLPGAPHGGRATQPRDPTLDMHARQPVIYTRPPLCVQVPTHLWEPTLLTGGVASVFTIALCAGLWFGGIKFWEKK